MIFAHPLWLLVLVLVPLPWLIARRKGYLAHPDTRHLSSLSSMSAKLFHFVPIVFIVLGLTALTVALARPQRLHILSKETFKSRDVLIAVDISGSMATRFGKVPDSIVGDTDLDKDFPGRPDRKQPDNNTQPPDPYGFTARVGERRIDAAQAAVLDFVRNRYLAKANDRLGIFVFDTDQYWSWPLTHDLKMIYRKVRFADAGLGGGTNFGNSKPGPMDAATEHLDEMGRAATRVLIMVTDGEDSIYPAAFERLKQLAAQYNLKLYVILVASNSQSADILSLAEATGGKGFHADNPAELKDCFQTIDQMEQSVVTVDTSENREELFYLFAFPALALILIGTLAEALILNQ